MTKISYKRLKQEWYGRPEDTLQYFKNKYGKKEMQKIILKVMK